MRCSTSDFLDMPIGNLCNHLAVRVRQSAAWLVPFELVQLRYVCAREVGKGRV